VVLKGDFVNQISDTAVDPHMKHASELPNMSSTMHLYHEWRGSAARQGRYGMELSRRRVSAGNCRRRSRSRQPNTIVNWARSYRDDPRPRSAGCAYVNFMMEDGEDREKAAYRDKYSAWPQ